MAAKIGITVDCTDCNVMSDFWAAALGYTKLFPDYIADPDGVGPRIWFQPVAEPKPGKNRWHLDVKAADMDAEVERLVGLGATKVDLFRKPGDSFTVMLDPEGNEFCVCEAV
jgi:predicted enzyme related to lactoylglutathione lyase